MGELYNQESQTQRRQELRRDLSKAERTLWDQLRGKQLGYKFRRQFGVGPFIIDFYCTELRLAIEVDGDSHFSPDDVERDRRRTKYLIEKGIHELRFTNDQVYNDMEGVIETINRELPRRPHLTSP